MEIQDAIRIIDSEVSKFAVNGDPILNKEDLRGEGLLVLARCSSIYALQASVRNRFLDLVKYTARRCRLRALEVSLDSPDAVGQGSSGDRTDMRIRLTEFYDGLSDLEKRVFRAVMGGAGYDVQNVAITCGISSRRAEDTLQALKRMIADI